MYFSDLRDPDTAPENKQRINLSKHAFDTLSHDASVFLPDDFTGTLPSGFINQIFLSCAESAESSIVSTLRSRREEYIRILSPMAPDLRLDRVLDLLLESEKQRLQERANQRLAEKGHSFSFRISKENLDQLRTPALQAEAACYQSRSGRILHTALCTSGAYLLCLRCPVHPHRHRPEKASEAMPAKFPSGYGRPYHIYEALRLAAGLRQKVQLHCGHALRQPRQR